MTFICFLFSVLLIFCDFFSSRFGLPLVPIVVVNIVQYSYVVSFLCLCFLLCDLFCDLFYNFGQFFIYLSWFVRLFAAWPPFVIFSCFLTWGVSRNIMSRFAYRMLSCSSSLELVFCSFLHFVYFYCMQFSIALRHCFVILLFSRSLCAAAPFLYDCIFFLYYNMLSSVVMLLSSYVAVFLCYYFPISQFSYVPILFFFLFFFRAPILYLFLLFFSCSHIIFFLFFF